MSRQLYRIQDLGLSAHECEMLIDAVNGVLTDPSIGLTGAYLALLVGDRVEEIEHEIRRFPKNVKSPMFKPVTEEEAGELMAKLVGAATNGRKFVEKLLEFEDWKAATALYYAYGVWDGIRKIREELEDIQ